MRCDGHSQASSATASSREIDRSDEPESGEFEAGELESDELEAMSMSKAVSSEAVNPERRLLTLAGTGFVLQALGGCAAAIPATTVTTAADNPSWQGRLRHDTAALLGEVHDNPEVHRLRAAALRRACEAGWRPAIVMEQFDLDRQADLDRGRREKPHDAEHLIARASPGNSGWHWAYYEPVIALALAFDLPLLAGNLARAKAARIVGDGYEAVLGARRVRELGLNAPVDPRWQAAVADEIDAGHCGMLPAAMLPGMVRAQFARDASMAQVLLQNAAHGAVLIAGNGHVRRDFGVPRWLTDLPPKRVLAVGFIEAGDAVTPGQFDAVVVTAGIPRNDPCKELAPR